MTIEEKAREIALDYDKLHRNERMEYYTGILEYSIVIDASLSYPHKYEVALYDGLYSDDEYLECLTEERETIVDAVEDILKDIAEWEKRSPTNCYLRL